VLNKSDQVDAANIARVLDSFDTKQRDQLLVISCAQGDNIDAFVCKLTSAVKDKYVFLEAADIHKCSPF
jgi:50S ribosomal subunit-associated GTPase HflX